jgi:hypothetical protein
MFLRGLGSRVLELGGESGTDRNPTVYPGSYVEYGQSLDMRRLGSIRRSCRAFVLGEFLKVSGANASLRIGTRSDFAVPDKSTEHSQ